MVDNSKRPLEQIDLPVEDSNKKQKIELSENEILLKKIRGNNSEIVQIELLGEEDNNFLSNVFKALKENNTVKKIDLTYSELNYENIKNLSDIIKSNKISELNLDSTPLDNEKIKILAEAFRNNDSLNSLSLGFIPLEIESLKILIDGIKDHTNLNTLILCGEKMGDEGAEIISKIFYSNSSIKYLDVSGNNISTDGAKTIAENIGNSKLISLNMGFNDIGDKGIIILLEALNGNKHIKDLILNSIGISEKSTETIKNFLISTPISNLVLEDNNLGDGVQNLANALKTNPWLKTLNLNDTGLDYNNIRTLTEALIENVTLDTLRLSNNLEIGDSGVEIISDMLLNNNSLKNIDLININLGDLGAIYLSAVLQKKLELLHPNLSELDLTDNFITNFGEEKLKPISGYLNLIVKGNDCNNLMPEEKTETLGENN